MLGENRAEPHDFSVHGSIERSEVIGAWITAALDGSAHISPCSLLEMGSEDGTLLARLATHFPTALATGLELNPQTAHAVRAAGLDIRSTHPDELSGSFDFVVSVVVIEYTSPRAVCSRRPVG